MLPRVVIYTDGSCDKYMHGGWAASLYYGHDNLHICGGEYGTTNNRMELTAVLRALQELTTRCYVVVYSDSQYVVNGINKYVKVWQHTDWTTATGKPVMNSDLWKMLNDLLKVHPTRAIWVKGHNGNPYNEIVDGLAFASKPQ